MIQEHPSFMEFIRLGIAHIGALASEWVGPQGVHLPDGIDHILFILALVLAGGTLWQTLKSTMGFTVGHSIALALASFGEVHFPGRWVESAIALSIAYIAAEDLLRKSFNHRWTLAALFGVVHGFGFATALDGLGLSGAGKLQALTGFTLGVEIGQAMWVALMIPLVRLLRQEPALGRYGVSTCSFAVFLTGAYWFVIRALG